MVSELNMKQKDCFGEFDKDDCCDGCPVAVECYEERNYQLMKSLARGRKQ